MELAFSFYATGGVATREKDEGEIQRRDAADRYMRNSKTALAEKQRMQMVRARDEHSELHNKEKKKFEKRMLVTEQDKHQYQQEHQHNKRNSNKEMQTMEEQNQRKERQQAKSKSMQNTEELDQQKQKQGERHSDSDERMRATEERHEERQDQVSMVMAKKTSEEEILEKERGSLSETRSTIKTTKTKKTGTKTTSTATTTKAPSMTDKESNQQEDEKKRKKTKEVETSMTTKSSKVDRENQIYHEKCEKDDTSKPEEVAKLNGRKKSKDAIKEGVDRDGPIETDTEDVLSHYDEINTIHGVASDKLTSRMDDHEGSGSRAGSAEEHKLREVSHRSSDSDEGEGVLENRRDEQSKSLQRQNFSQRKKKTNVPRTKPLEGKAKRMPGSRSIEATEKAKDRTELAASDLQKTVLVGRSIQSGASDSNKGMEGNVQQAKTHANKARYIGGKIGTAIGGKKGEAAAGNVAMGIGHGVDFVSGFGAARSARQR